MGHTQYKKQLDPSDHWCGSPKPGPHIFPVDDASAGCTFSELEEPLIILLGGGIALSSSGSSQPDYLDALLLIPKSPIPQHPKLSRDYEKLRHSKGYGTFSWARFNPMARNKSNWVNTKNTYLLE